MSGGTYSQSFAPVPGSIATVRPYVVVTTTTSRTRPRIRIACSSIGAESTVPSRWTRRALSDRRLRAVIPVSAGPTPLRWASKLKRGQSPPGTSAAAAVLCCARRRRCDDPQPAPISATVHASAAAAHRRILTDRKLSGPARTTIPAGSPGSTAWATCAPHASRQQRACCERQAPRALVWPRRAPPCRALERGASPAHARRSSLRC